MSGKAQDEAVRRTASQNLPPWDISPEVTFSPGGHRTFDEGLLIARYVPAVVGAQRTQAGVGEAPEETAVPTEVEYRHPAATTRHQEPSPAVEKERREEDAREDEWCEKFEFVRRDPSGHLIVDLRHDEALGDPLCNPDADQTPPAVPNDQYGGEVGDDGVVDTIDEEVVFSVDLGSKVTSEDVGSAEGIKEGCHDPCCLVGLSGGEHLPAFLLLEDEKDEREGLLLDGVGDKAEEKEKALDVAHTQPVPYSLKAVYPLHPLLQKMFEATDSR